MRIIKLKDLLHEQKLIEAVADLPPKVKFIMPPEQHAYAEPAGDKSKKGMEPYVSKNKDFGGLGTSSIFQITDDFVNYVKTVENGVKKGFWNGIWKPIQSPENPNSYDIAYGHKIKRGENFSKGLSDLHATLLLKKDLEIAKQNVERYLKSHKMPINLNQEQWEMLIDYAFNLGGLEKFPKMVRAIVTGDLVSAKTEYKRYANIGGTRKELGRNDNFYKRYLSNAKSPTWKGRVA